MQIQFAGRILPVILLLGMCAGAGGQSGDPSRPTTQFWQGGVLQLTTSLEDLARRDAAFQRVRGLVTTPDLELQYFNPTTVGSVRMVYSISTPGVAYLGIGVDPPNDTLRAQLALPEGAGLVVNYVDEKGPSHGQVSKHDVLQKLDDQILVNAEQLMTLVRMHKPEETVSLTLIREAKPQTVRVKLGVKQEDGMHVATYPVQDLIVPLEFQSAPPASQPAGPAVLKDIPLVGKLLASGELKTRPITFNDGDLLACIDGTGNLLAIDVKTGSIIFRGPITTEEQWKNAPQIVRDKLAAWKALIAPPCRGSEKGQDTGK